MRASSWASTTTRRARSVNRSNMGLSSNVYIKPDLGSQDTTPEPAYAFPGRPQATPLTANTGHGGRQPGGRWDTQRSVITNSTRSGRYVVTSAASFGGENPIWLMPWAYWTVVPKEVLHSGERALPMESRSVS